MLVSKQQVGRASEVPVNFLKLVNPHFSLRSGVWAAWGLVVGLEDTAQGLGPIGASQGRQGPQ